MHQLPSSTKKLECCQKQTSALLTIGSTDETIKLLALNDQLLIADVPLHEVTDLAAKEFKAIYNTISKEIIKIIS